jgi:putative zinc finger/helix-turn-helix YgiT family protein
MEPRETQETVRFRGLDLTVVSGAFVCPECGLELATVEQAARVQKNISRAYREAAGLMTGEDIRGAREKRGLTQEGLAALLGVGIASVKRWEGVHIQTKSMDTLLRKALAGESCANPDTGNRNLSLPRVKQVICAFEALLKRRLFENKGLFSGKYLWYADMLAFRETGQSLTGAMYARLPFGPQLNNYTDLFPLIKGADISELPPLDEADIAIIARVARRFPRKKDVFKASHKEPAWLNTSTGDLIPYPLAETLAGI